MTIYRQIVIAIGGLGAILLLLTHMSYYSIKDNYIALLKKESNRGIRQINRAIKEKSHSFRIAYACQTETQKLIKEEDLNRLRNTFHIFGREEWPSCQVGIIIIHNSRNILSSGNAIPVKNIQPYLEAAKVNPQRVYTICQNKKFIGIMSFKICNSHGENPLKDSAILLLLNWNNFLKRHISLSEGLKYELSKEIHKDAISVYPLKDIDRKVTGYIDFSINYQEIGALTSHTRQLLIISNIVILLLLVFSFIYIKRHATIAKTLLSVFGKDKKEVTLKTIAEHILEILAANKLYIEALKTAISTKSFEETMKTTANTAAKIARCNMWSIISTTGEIDSWHIMYSSCMNRIDAKKVNQILIKEKSLLLETAKEKNQVVIAKLEKPIYLPLLQTEEKKLIFTNIAIPIALSGEVIAILNLSWYKKREIPKVSRRISYRAKEVIEDVLKNAKEAHKMLWLSYMDPLLNIYNRRIVRHLAEKNLNGSILFIDIDNFKQVNDIHGHATGDMVLKKIVHIISKNLRRGDVLFRFGGDEFVIYLEGIKEPIATEIKERIEKFVEESLREFGITLSIGVVEIDPESDIMEAIKIADKEMYMGKRRKRDGRQNIDK